MRYRIFFVSIILFATSCKHRDVVSDFIENRKTGLSLYLYPSTLRMINIDRNEEYDKMIREVEKARFFRLDSGQFLSEDVSTLIIDLQENGFEEVMSVQDKNQDIRVMALESKIPEIVVVSKKDKELMLLEINGMINIAKIPKLIQTFSQNSFLDILDLNGDKKEKK